MSTTITLSEDVADHLSNLTVGQTEDVDKKLRLLLIAEYRRRLTRYRLTDQQMNQKYNMNFTEFEERQITKQHNYSWDVESDAIVWETAVDGIRTVKRQLAELTQKG
ncbi:MAG TPA: hypothetical protein EYP41_17700 [Anaerolineae bacterium]|nr:hypothetical protein [Anaerolineae bacterium]HIP73924.1 hypothetical protein [Anaerolineae bacterium]